MSASTLSSFAKTEFTVMNVAYLPAFSSSEPPRLNNSLKGCSSYRHGRGGGGGLLPRLWNSDSDETFNSPDTREGYCQPAEGILDATLTLLKQYQKHLLDICIVYIGLYWLNYNANDPLTPQPHQAMSYSFGSPPSFSVNRPRPIAAHLNINSPCSISSAEPPWARSSFLTCCFENISVSLRHLLFCFITFCDKWLLEMFCLRLNEPSFDNNGFTLWYTWGKKKSIENCIL